MTNTAPGLPDSAHQSNHLLRRARLLVTSPSGSGRPMSRQELAEAVNAHLFHTNGIRAAVDAHYVARLERGKRRRPTAAYRDAFRAVLGATTDTELGFYARSAADEAFAASDPVLTALSTGTNGNPR